MTIIEVLQNIQAELKVPKTRFNNFGGYKFRNCEDILNALKPILAKHNAAVTIPDKIECVGDRFYVTATATLHWNGETISCTASAREPLSKKGMDEAQITGSTSSYARKYALNGLFALDDSKDTDISNDDEHKDDDSPITEKQIMLINELCEDTETNLNDIINYLNAATLEELTNSQAIYVISVLMRKPRKKK